MGLYYLNGIIIYIMPRDHFAQANKDPRYSSRFYTHAESKEAMSEKQVRIILSKTINFIKRIVGKK